MTLRQIMICTLVGVLAVLPTRAEMLDDFEEGSAAGWQGVGHGSGEGYSVSIVSPGYESRYALRITDKTQDGFCGVSIDNLQKLKLQRDQSIRLAARSVKDVMSIIIDVYCTDGTRWQKNVPLNPNGAWTPIEVQSKDFYLSQNPQNISASQLDTSKIAYLWLIFDTHVAGAKTPWLLDIDDVAFVEKDQKPREEKQTTPPATTAEPSTECKGRFGILDDSGFYPQTVKVNPAKAIAEVLRASGASVECIPPQDWSQKLDSGTIHTAVLLGTQFPVDADKAMIRHLKAGRSLWYIGTTNPFTKPMQQESSRTWTPASPYVYSPDAIRILDGAVLSYHRLQLHGETLELTPRGHKWWPFSPKRIAAENCGFLAANDSIYKPCTPPWVQVTPLLEARYDTTNWIHQNDQFTGWVASMFSHRAGPFRGAKVLFIGLGFGKDKFLDPGNPNFSDVVLRCAKELDTPIKNLWAQDPIPPTGDLSALQRVNWFSFPGPIFASINFDGIPANDPTFWENQRMAGFSTVLVEVPFLPYQNDQGEIIDWAKADEFIKTAQEHEQSVVFDPYSISHWRWYWAGELSLHNPEFLRRYAQAMGEFALRYKDNPTVKALFVLPYTIAYGTFQVDSSADGRNAWITYVRDTLGLSLTDAKQRYGKSISRWEDLPLPEHREQDRFNLAPIWSDYLNFFLQAHSLFTRTTIQSIRQNVPQMPLYLRGPYLDVGMHMSVASEFDNVAPHCECIETTLDIEAYYRGLAQTFGVPISAENGRPKTRGGPLRMAMASYLMGGYRSFFYSFGGPLFARPGILDFHKAEELSLPLKKASYVKTNLALLIPDTTMYASTPPIFMSVEGLPHIEYAMERSGFSFRAVSAQFPKLDGVKFLLDDGANFVLTQTLRHALVAWVRQGGTLFVFPETGQFDLAGEQETLAGALGISFDLPKQKNHMVHSVGQGRVVVLSRQLLAGYYVDAKRWSILETLLENFGATREVRVTPRVSVACFHDDDKTYIVLANKTPNHVGAYFTESSLKTAEDSLPDLNLQVRPFFPFTEARDLRTGKTLSNNDGVISIPLPKTQYTILECARP